MKTKKRTRVQRKRWKMKMKTRKRSRYTLGCDGLGTRQSLLPLSQLQAPLVVVVMQLLQAPLLQANEVQGKACRHLLLPLRVVWLLHLTTVARRPCRCLPPQAALHRHTLQRHSLPLPPLTSACAAVVRLLLALPLAAALACHLLPLLPPAALFRQPLAAL